MYYHESINKKYRNLYWISIIRNIIHSELVLDIHGPKNLSI